VLRFGVRADYIVVIYASSSCQGEATKLGSYRSAASKIRRRTDTYRFTYLGNIMKVNALLLSLLLTGPALLVASGAQAAPPASDYGMVAAQGVPARTINIDSSTRWVNVADGETVRFDVDGKSFNWTFGTRYRGEAVVDLATIAPPDVHVPDVRAYVAADARYYQG
jgi:hypothetical protein